MRNGRVAVLGGAGFIGRYVVRRLAAQGDVVAVGCRHAEDARLLQPMGNVGQIAMLNVPIDDEARLRAFVAGSRAVVNCVGTLVEHRGQSFETAHHTGPARLARLAREAGVERLVHLSAIGADAGSASAYARTKAQGEKAVADAFPTATILRPSVVFGPEDQFFNRFAAMAMIAPALPLIGGGHTRFQPVYVGDVADGVFNCLEDAATGGRLYELGGPRTYTMRQLFELVLEETGRKRLLIDLPFGIAALQSRLFALLPNPPLTPDQVEMLKYDNTVAQGALGLAELGIEPTAVEAILPTYLDRFRRGGWYQRRPSL
jgi:uncharacterized protein YbjT (DUF2867 family)